MKTLTRDFRLDHAQEAPDLNAVAMWLDYRRFDDAQETALWLMACELRLIRQILESTVDRGRVITQAFEW